MSRLRVATVVSARLWEASLVDIARSTGLVRVVARTSQLDQLEGILERVDVIVAGADTAWVTPEHLRSWRNAGPVILGIYPVGDRPARSLLLAGGVDEVLPDDTPASSVLQAVRLLAPDCALCVPPKRVWTESGQGKRRL